MSSWVLACQAIRFTHPQVANCFDSRTGKCHFGSGLCFAKGQHGQHVHNLLWFCNIIYADSAATGANHLHFQTPTVLQMQKYILKAANTERCESEQDRHPFKTSDVIPSTAVFLRHYCITGISHKDSYIIYAYVTARLCKAWLSESKTATPSVANVKTNWRKNPLNCKQRPCSLVKLPCLALWVGISCSQVQEGLANTMLHLRSATMRTFWIHYDQCRIHIARTTQDGKSACNLQPRKILSTTTFREYLSNTCNHLPGCTCLLLLMHHVFKFKRLSFCARLCLPNRTQNLEMK